ncbi:MAG TPA: hypothetical protein VFN79_18025 [Steroidobacteraceae bacterium]|nr:hypothetical protein [Steroidobacteraceae bacterium]
MLPNSWIAALTGVIGTAIAAMFSWLARHTIRRVDDLEKNSITRSEFEAFCASREQSDQKRGVDISRLEGKIDSYHQSISARIDRLLESRHGNR